ncbi:hypothetical protein KR009_007677, partial [Drosophila setifemur]
KNRQNINNFAVCILLVVFSNANCHSIGRANSNSNITNNVTLDLPEVQGDIFRYFGFGSNMLAKRIHIQNPTAVRVGPAVLDDYRLDFAFNSQRWNGVVATIVPTEGDQVWGTLWDIDLSNLKDIDNQEGVHLGIYEPRTVYVKLAGDTKLIAARAYLLTQQPQSNIYEIPYDSVPTSRQPSKTYLQCLVQGAIESSIPELYIQRLRRIKHNSQVVGELEQTLQLQNVQL